MNATDLVQALLDGINLPGYGDDTSSDEFAGNLKTAKLHSVRVVEVSYLNKPDFKTRFWKLNQVTFADFGMEIIDLEYDPNRIETKPGQVYAFIPVVITVKGQQEDIEGFVRHDVKDYQIEWVNEGINLPGYGDEADPDEFVRDSFKATFVCDLKALDKLNMERGDVPGVFGWLNSPLEELAEVVLTGAFEDCYGYVTEDQIELAHFSNCSKDGNMLKFTVTYDISLDGAGVSQVMSDLRNLDKVEYLKLSGKVTHA